MPTILPASTRCQRRLDQAPRVEDFTEEPIDSTESLVVGSHQERHPLNADEPGRAWEQR